MSAPSAAVPNVTVVMPAYNAQRYIVPTIESVLAQSYASFELLVIDDCSTDATAEIVDGFSVRDPRVRLIRLPKNRGAPAGPRNIGVAEGRGKWIAFLDADDIWHSQKLECQVAVLERTEAAFCSSQMVDFTDEAQLKFTPVSVTDPPLERIGFFKQLVKFRTPTSSVVLLRDLISRHPFNEDPTFKAREDLDCWLRCHEEIGSSIKVLHALVGYRLIAGQISGQKWRMVKRHHHVLRQYRFRSGRALGAGAAVFTVSHFLLSVYYRVLKKGL